MTGFLDDMAASSQRRARQLREREPMSALMRRARERPAAPPLKLSTKGFDVIAELKLRSPAVGVLGRSVDAWPDRVQAYARGGAAAVSVLTEPDRFDGSLDHLDRAAQVLEPFGVPVMRKDFLVDPCQVWEARAYGAGGVLVIVRMLDDGRMAELLDCAAQNRMFVLLEAFDGTDLARAESVLRRRHGGGEQILVGVNCRDLQTLEVLPGRFDDLASHLPQGWPGVAESGVNTPEDAARMARLGYRLALIGSALMRAPDPQDLIGRMLVQARAIEP